MSVNEPTLYVAFELGKREWKLAMTSGFGVEPWLRTVASGDLRAVERVLRDGRRRFALAADARVVSCYEAGRDGFWIHRALTQLGVANRVVDSASIEVNRRARRAKTDRLDALETGADVGPRRLRRAEGVERSAGADGGGRSGAPGESRADSVDAGSDAAGQSDARVAGDVGRHACRRGAAGAGGQRCAIGPARRCPRAVQARMARAEARLQGLEAQIAELDGQQQIAVTTAAPTSARAAAGAAQGCGDDQRVGITRRRLGVAGVPESAADWRAAGICAHPV